MLKQSLSQRDDLKAVLAAASDVWRELDSPRSLTCEILRRYGEWDQLVRLECDPAQYLTLDSFRRSYWATSIIRKYELVPTTIDRKAVALASFHESEERCRETNLRLMSGWMTQQGAVLRVFRRMVERVHALLGEADRSTYADILAQSRWGTGSTSSCKGAYTSLYHKAAAKPQCTPELGPDIARAAYAEFAFLDHHREFPVVPGSRLDFVPKDAKTDRAICIEPHVNAFLQRGAGVVLRRRLRRWGLDLNNQPAVQAELAARAYDEGLATIDLSSASDSVSSQLVRALLPDSWAMLLDRLRSWRVQLPSGEFHHLQKHSSMGNGYTFELETLIFASVVLAVRAEVGDHSAWGVYGDDIICHSRCAPLVLETLAALGFVPNKSKTFTQGCFFESCGSDFYQGSAVRPFFFKEGRSLPKHLAYLQWLRRAWPWTSDERLIARHRSRLPRGWRSTYGPHGELCVPWIYPTSFKWDASLGWVTPARVVQWVPDSVVPEDSPFSAFAALFIHHKSTCDEWGFREPYERVATARKRGKWVVVRRLYAEPKGAAKQPLR